MNTSVFTLIAAVFSVAGILWIAKQRTKRFHLYLPAMLAAVGILVVLAKYVFISKGNDVIFDIVLIMLFSVILGMFLLLAVSVDAWNYWLGKRNT
ncbi:hypothetical protein [Indiicoccus explosivorum]|uniref:hypothetical protein n=1 Tax=Indiicoccus explosivorum TaxID=1917864 RepID=UPI000B43117B|nr:hypothetical protein [Indiicoccus explosivorum]